MCLFAIEDLTQLLPNVKVQGSLAPDIALINHHPSATEAQFLFQICKGSIWTLKGKNVCELVNQSVNAISNMYPFDFKLIVE